MAAVGSGPGWSAPLSYALEPGNIFFEACADGHWVMSQVLASFFFAQDGARDNLAQIDLVLLPSTLPSLLLSELLLLQRLREKNAAQHRSAIFFRKLQEVERIGKRIYERVLALCEVQARVTGAGKRADATHPVSSSFEPIAVEEVKVQIATHKVMLEALIRKALPVLTRATDSVNKMISHLHFLPFTSLLLAVYARLWTLFLDVSSYVSPDVKPRISSTTSAAAAEGAKSDSILFDAVSNLVGSSGGIDERRFVAAGSMHEHQARAWYPLHAEDSKPRSKKRKMREESSFSFKTPADGLGTTATERAPAAADNSAGQPSSAARYEVQAPISRRSTVSPRSHASAKVSLDMSRDTTNSPKNSRPDRIGTDAEAQSQSQDNGSPRPSSTKSAPKVAAGHKRPPEASWQDSASSTIVAPAPADLAVAKKVKKQKVGTSKVKPDGVVASGKTKKKRSSDLDDIFGF